MARLAAMSRPTEPAASPPSPTASAADPAKAEPPPAAPPVAAAHPAEPDNSLTAPPISAASEPQPAFDEEEALLRDAIELFRRPIHR